MASSEMMGDDDEDNGLQDAGGGDKKVPRFKWNILKS